MAEDDLTPDLRSAVRALRAERGPCPPPDALVEYDALDDAARRRHAVHDHAQVCSRCQLVLLNISEPVAERSRWLHPGMLAAAAVLAIAIATPFLYRTIAPPAVEDTVRGTELQPVAPAGRVREVLVFEWHSPIVTPRYRVELFRGADVVWTAESTRRTLGAGALPPLEPGIEYSWQVHAIDAEGSVRLSSPRQRFEIVR